MKRLIIVRHAKSSWKEFSLADKDRPLNKRGIQNAKDMGTYLLTKKFDNPYFLSSPAKRALDTAVLISETIQNNPNIAIKEALYTFSDSNNIFIQEASQVDNQFETVFIFSHNETCFEFVHSICPNEVHDFPTCAVACFRADINHWSELKKEKLRLEFFQIPKEL